MPSDTRPTVNLGTRYGKSKGEAAKAAKTLREGQARADAEYAQSKRRVATKVRSKRAEGYRDTMRRKRLSPSPTTVGPTSKQFQYTVE